MNAVGKHFEQMKKNHEPKKIDGRWGRGLFLTEGAESRAGGDMTAFIGKGRADEWSQMSKMQKKEWDDKAKANADTAAAAAAAKTEERSKAMNEMAEREGGEANEVLAMDTHLRNFMRGHYVGDTDLSRRSRDTWDKKVNEWCSIQMAKQEEAEEIVVGRFCPTKLTTLGVRAWSAMQEMRQGNEKKAREYLTITKKKKKIDIADLSQLKKDNPDVLVLCLKEEEGKPQKWLLVVRCVMSPYVLLCLQLTHTSSFVPTPKKAFIMAGAPLKPWSSERRLSETCGREYTFWLGKYRWVRPKLSDGPKKTRLAMQYLREFKFDPEYAKTDVKVPKKKYEVKLESVKIAPVKGDITMKRDYVGLDEGVGTWAGRLAAQKETEEQDAEVDIGDFIGGTQGSSSASSLYSSSSSSSSSSVSGSGSSTSSGSASSSSYHPSLTSSSSSSSSRYVSFPQRLASLSSPEAKEAQERQKRWAQTACLTAYRFTTGAYENKDGGSGEKKIAMSLLSWENTVKEYAHNVYRSGEDVKGGIFQKHIKLGTGGKSFRCAEGEAAIAAGSAFVQVYSKCVQFAVRHLKSFILCEGGELPSDKAVSLTRAKQQYDALVAGLSTQRTIAKGDEKASRHTDDIIESLKLSLPLLAPALEMQWDGEDEEEGLPDAEAEVAGVEEGEGL